MNIRAEYKKEVVLIGGGHTHALLLNMWAKMPIEGLRITLVSPSVSAPYSGMLPGLIAGHFSFEQAHIDLPRLCQLAGARFVQASVTRVDSVAQRIQLSDRPALSYDVASINTGLTPDVRVLGVDQYTTPIKPISGLYERWLALSSHLKAQAKKGLPIRIAVVGGGAAAVELIQAVAARIAREPGLVGAAKFVLLQGKSGLPENYPRSIQHAIAQQFKSLNIEIIENFLVSEIERSDTESYRLTSATGDTQTASEIFWCTHGRGADWIKGSNLPVDEQGFIQTNPELNVANTKTLFACGDCATIIGQERPKAGVYAVRQAPTLHENIVSSLEGKRLRAHRSQKSFLSIITGGNQWAVASKGRIAFGAPLPSWVWRWKRSIDESFMRQFLPDKNTDHFAPMQRPFNAKSEPHKIAMRCGGCGAKISNTILRAVLKDVNTLADSSIVIGLGTSDDCAVISPPRGKLLSQSVDILKNLVSDPYLQGQVSAEHALSDLFAMGARPHSAQAIVNLPIAAERLIENDLRQLMAGATEVLNRHNCMLVGGHTSEASELSIGFSVNGFCDPEELFRKSSVRSGDCLVLTKPLGIGMLFAAHNLAAAKGVWIETAIDAMLLSNAGAARIAEKFDVGAMTDVTGFGLLGHLLEMLAESNFCAQLYLDQLPILEGAQSVCDEGYVSSLHGENQKQMLHLAPEHLDHVRTPFLFDPQTSGGLLMAVAQQDVEHLHRELIASGYGGARVIGRIEDSRSGERYRVYSNDSTDRGAP
ncbi:MAG: selenide, water dikinase SelD [Cellvibrionaceae bacterium]